MIAANRKQWSHSNSTPPYAGVNENPHRVKPIVIVLKSVLTTAKRRMVPILSKNGLDIRN